MRTCAIVTVIIAAVTAVARGTTPEEFRAAMAKKATELGARLEPERGAKGAKATPAVKGQDGFYFLTSEIRSYAVGEFWGEKAATVGAGVKNQDPLPAILDFHRQCKQAGVELILVPVPGKVVVYADKLDPSLKVALDPKNRLDAVHREFYDVLEKEGVKVIDLTPTFLGMRKEVEARGGARQDGLAHAPPYCKTDSHWSPLGMSRTAGQIATDVTNQAWAKASPGTFLDGAGGPGKDAEVTGDLAAALGAKDKETITIFPRASDVLADDAPLVLAGDSHALVYDDPGLLATDAGLAKALSGLTGYKIDLIAAKGSGANASRITLARRRDDLAGKKCVVWVFAARELTESAEGWQKIPVVQ